MVVNMARNRVVHSPPETWRARYAGTSTSREMSRVLENESEPAASAGRGAFLIAGY